MCSDPPVDISLKYMSNLMEGKYDQGPIYLVPDMIKSRLKAEIGQVSAYVSPT